MSRVKFQCKRCGHCCIVPLAVGITRSEKRKNKFKMVYSENSSSWILKKKTAYIPELKKERRVCYYYDPDSRSCLIHNDKPKACRSFNCQSRPIDWIKEWYDYLKQ